MNEKEQLTPEKHKEQIEAYEKELPHYKRYAVVLKRVLEKACEISIPERVVQSRAKTKSSFAEKCVRKYDKYKDAVHEFTDLCGARVIVQTLEQVEAVKKFISANFKICEEDDKTLNLSEDKFGYRDMHYIIQLKQQNYKRLGISDEDFKYIDKRKAEIQVRTWLQHAWADTLHDRIYKNKLNISKDIHRTGALQAALMEEGDRNFNQLADELDGQIANYMSYASKDEVKREINIQKLILSNEPEKEKKPSLALKLARLQSACGEYKQVKSLLSPYTKIYDANRCELLQVLGYSLCKLKRNTPSSSIYQKGLSYLKESLDICESIDVPFVPHFRRCESLHARGHDRLAWALEVIDGEQYQARDHYYQAHEHEPFNPYYLADMLGFEIFCTHAVDIPKTMRTSLKQAIKTCQEHAMAGIELPYAYFTAGRLSLLLRMKMKSIGWYARGIYYIQKSNHCVPGDLLENESEWIRRLSFGNKLSDVHCWILDLIALQKSLPTPPVTALKIPKVLIMTGGAATINQADVKKIRPFIKDILEDYTGTVISGGTRVGLPGCVGDVALSMKEEDKLTFKLQAYIPKSLPHDAPKHDAYEHKFDTGSVFSPSQVLKCWADLLNDNINPHEVMCIGFGGGSISEVEYWIALGFGATVVAVQNSGGTCDKLIKDPIWSNMPNLLPLPRDKASFYALLKTSSDHDDVDYLEMAKEFHSLYVAGKSKDLPPNMRPWDKLEPTYQKSNLEQARYVIRILKISGFDVRIKKNPTIFDGFTSREIIRMARLEHGRWNVERLRAGWQPGENRNEEKRIHDCIVPWKKLPNKIKMYDINAVKRFPEILAKVGLEVYRL